MDVVYFVDSRTRNFRPLRLSIKSLRKNISARDIYLIGVKPEGVEGVEMKYDDRNKKIYHNARNKLRMAIGNEKISEDFILMYDDVYLLKEMKELPYYHLGKIKDFVEDKNKRSDFISPFWRNVIRSMNRMFPDGYFYESHSPIIYNKKKLQEAFEKKSKMGRSTLRTFYCNYWKVSGVGTKDFKIYKKEDFDSWDKPIVSTSTTTETTKILDQIEQMI
ncbi:MAG: hypothetical protein PHP37_03990 [Patescibacteria group bacterium]|jgi:hypothetical protein|nr:hypothetical protein [Patescibacteria group bacterium]